VEIRTAAVFGAAGKIGRRLVELLRTMDVKVKALQHKSPVPDQCEVVKGSVTDAEAVNECVRHSDVVLQLATTKEDPDSFFEVSVGGTFKILEACRKQAIRQFILLGGDAAFGIWFYPQPTPIDENHPYQAYPGYYAFSKVIEEVMTRQYGIQYGVPFTILRSSWVFEGDDLLKHFSLLENISPEEEGHGFGEITPEILSLVRAGEDRIPLLLDGSGVPLRRHIVHIDDVVQVFRLSLGNEASLGQSFNVAGPAPFSYDVAARYLSEKTGVPTIDINCPNYHSFEINITRCRTVLGYAPENDFFRMADRALAVREKRVASGA